MRVQDTMRVAAALVPAVLLVGSSTTTSSAVAPAPAAARPAPGHSDSEWLMMGPGCGASTS